MSAASSRVAQIAEHVGGHTRVALVTGAAQGIGLCIALRLADDGLDVAVNDLSSKVDLLEEVVLKIREKGRRSIAVPADVTQDQQVKQMIATVAEKLGGLDVMVANAGILLVKPLLETTPDEWDRSMTVNTRSMMLSYKYAAEQMIAQGRGGRIIGASSIAGKKGSIGLPAYCATKFAVRGLTQSAAEELAKHNITVNAYAPGIITTNMGADLAAGFESLRIDTAVPVAEPEVVSSVVSFLAKPESYFITGQSLSVNGGAYFD
ncbi:uncharacterized protein FIBRA_03243 [Fibroporia radiculosa]|uniref:Uncharacterized protein n=1 Tax=Fibroporia radiculosa TaxID=599839 RepID=J4GND4_9APHY|nr:uncharacterized protein FIBRA_03243 [Fibroporia radiculosa]CCM01195.1 predicted protein [Fibroporia radiculosa]